MSKKILIINGSYKKDGNTMTAIRWVQEGMNFKGAASEIINISSVKNRYSGCIGYPNGLSLLSKYMKELIAGFGNDLHQLLVPGCTADPKDLKMRTEIREKAETFGQDLASRS